MKEAGYEIIGYARSSNGKKDDLKRVSLLNPRIEILKTRSLEDLASISPNSSAGDPFQKKDEKKKAKS
ncbi:uncharacterized protein EV154DRAFT_514418 [Mucor mucedo]|uniref:uncharacterized protein n=1 Tax=Mucor mucedo TaxID=29922 RepID=UPI0022206584|nr:uncharacterized protein EV154DRAFT_514418 [Mucor mucedo]KAI7889490.1 hypothetical protein EV154DRAFT_514418 [Mucor mucedo]